MRKPAICFLLCILITLTACTQNLTNKSDIISLYQENEELFLQAASTEDYSKIEGINGVQKIRISKEYIDIQCGSTGFASGTHYYGIFYSPDDNLCAIYSIEPTEKLTEHGDGYLYQENAGDNRFYVEPLGNHFFYYEVHF